MSNVKPKIIVIVGPTASGKSDAAIKLAKKLNGGIISADSRQIYKGMDLGTGKVARDKGQGTRDKETYMSHVTGHMSQDKQEGFVSEDIDHYLIDVANPEEEFNISHFKTLANEAIETILQQGKLPIICGGTGFWIAAITNNTSIPEVAPNPQLRAELEKKSLEELFEDLKKFDPERAETMDRQNKYRLVRALEIISVLGKVPSQSSVTSHQSSKYDFLEIGISVSREILNAKIKKRLESRFDEGMIEEVENLHANGASFEWMEKIGLEYRWISRFLERKVSIEEMKEKLYFDIIHYAKRQMTWFKKNKEIIWLDNYEDIEKEVMKFL